MEQKNFLCTILLIVVFNFANAIKDNDSENSGKFGFLMPNVHPHRVS